MKSYEDHMKSYEHRIKSYENPSECKRIWYANLNLHTKKSECKRTWYANLNLHTKSFYIHRFPIVEPRIARILTQPGRLRISKHGKTKRLLNYGLHDLIHMENTDLVTWFVKGFGMQI